MFNQIKKSIPCIIVPWEKQPITLRAWASVAWDYVRVAGLGLTFTIVKMLGPNKTYQTQTQVFHRRNNLHVYLIFSIFFITHYFGTCLFRRAICNKNHQLWWHCKRVFNPCNSFVIKHAKSESSHWKLNVTCKIAL